ncbi:tetratricopeptide repeat-containing sensor histidine kinase [Allomuricauda sp. d1]|uniref:tetratricopeptide repeat-containing sensor histidine kinase n=1 Tax=Allomuricauda sp. d1 TaxID=3136725 RepID=UPI0031E245DE
MAYEIQEVKAKPDFKPTDTLYINLSNLLADRYRFVNSDSLYQMSKVTLKLSKQIDYKYGQCEAMDNLGDFYSDRGDSKEAIKYYQEALPLTRKIGHLDLELSLLNDLGKEYDYLGDYAQALESFLKGIDLAKKYDNKDMLSIINENIGSIYASQKDYDQALEFYKKAKKYNEELGNEIYIAETLSNLASLYTDTKQFDYAMFSINKSIGIFEKLQILDWLAFAYEVKGRIYLQQEKYNWALYWYNESSRLHENLDDKRGEIDLLNGMAKTHFKLGNDSISLALSKRGYTIAQQLNSIQGQIDCSETLYHIHKKQGQFDKSLQYLEFFKELSDSLSKDKNRRSLSLLEAKLEYEKQQQNLIAENQKALAKQRNYIYLAFVILLILGVVTLLVYRNEKIQKKLNKELKEKSKVLQQREVELSTNNKTKTKLFSIIGHDLRGPVGALQGLLKMFLSKEINEKEFFGLLPKLKSDIDHIHFTLNNLLSWGQTQMNGVVTKPKSITLETIVDENINLLKEIANKKSIKLLNQMPENVTVWADLNQIDIVVRNLISNALKFTPENGLVTIEAKELKNVWQVSVRDTGIGMDEETQEKLFTELSTHTTYGTNNEKGTGLGLSLCKEMVEKNKGEIWVESQLKKGSTFYFTIPKGCKKYKKAG